MVRVRSRLDQIRALAVAVASAARMAAASTGPRWERRAVGGSVAAQPRAAARMPPIRSRAQGCALDRTRPPHALPEGRLPAGRDLRGVFSLVTFFGQAKKVTRPPRGGRNPATMRPMTRTADLPFNRSTIDHRTSGIAVATPATAKHRRSPHTITRRPIAGSQRGEPGSLATLFASDAAARASVDEDQASPKITGRWKRITKLAPPSGTGS